MPELENSLMDLIAKAEQVIANSSPSKKSRTNRGNLSDVREALSTLKASLVALHSSASEHGDLVPESRLALVTIEGRMLSGDWPGARDFVDNVPFRSIVSAQESRFKDAAVEIYRARKIRPLGLFIEKPRPVIVENIRTVFGMPAVKPGADQRNELLSRLGHLRSWPRNIDAALYWIAHAAEQAYLTGDLPPQPEEDDYNAVLPLALQNAAKKHWSSLVTALGYSRSLPFEIGRFISTRRTIEPLTGLDFALVVYLRLEDGNPRIYTAIVQGKPEHPKKPFMAKIFRASKNHGRNHQLRALADKAQTSYYAFYPKDRATSPTSIVPVKTVVDELERRLPGVALKDMKASDCYISIEAGAVDLPTFFAKLLMNHAGHKTMSDAIRDLGSPRRSLGEKARDMSSMLAKRLILVEVGSRIPEAELKPIFDLGFERSADFGMTQDMSSWTP